MRYCRARYGVGAVTQLGGWYAPTLTRAKPTLPLALDRRRYDVSLRHRDRADFSAGCGIVIPRDVNEEPIFTTNFTALGNTVTSNAGAAQCGPCTGLRGQEEYGERHRPRAG